MKHSLLQLVVYVCSVFAVAVMSTATTASADTKRIAVFEVDNQTQLSDDDMRGLSELLTTVLKTSPGEGDTVDLLELGAVEGDCDDDCLAQTAADAWADLAVQASVTSVGDGYMVLLKLFDAKEGRLLASETASTTDGIGELIEPIEAAAQKIRSTIWGIPYKEDAADVASPVKAPRRAGHGPKPGKNHGILEVTSSPSGASVYVGDRTGTKYVGKTPIRKKVSPKSYLVKVYKKRYNRETANATVDAGTTKRVHIDLYKSKRLMTAGHGLLWPGIVLTGASAAFFLADADLKPGGVVSAAVGGTFIAAGATLLITGGIRLKKERKSREARALAPVIGPHGGGAMYFQTF